MTFTAADVQSILPALVLVIGAFATVGASVFVRPEKRQGTSEFLAYASLLFALGAVLMRLFRRDGTPAALEGFNGAVRLDELALFLSLTVIASAGLTVVLSADIPRDRGVPHGEYYALVLLAAAGMLVLVQAAELITFFIAIEMLSLALYALTGLYRRDPRSNEASIKYFVMGAFASGFLLYGMALLYGATGAIHLTEIARKVQGGLAAPGSFVTLGALLMAIGLAFKVGAVPFHQWVPDVYEGAPTPVTAFMSVSVKAAGFGAFLRVVFAVSAPVARPNGTFAPDALGDVLWALAMATLILPNLLAVWQRSVKRMLAYSSVAHTGYVLAAVASMRAATDLQRTEAAAGAVYYLFVYTFMTLGAFAFLAYAGKGGGDAETLDDLSGLAKRRPWAAMAMTVFMVSLAGIPPAAGFFGKLVLFRAMVASGEWALVVTGVLSSAVSVYYYLRVVVAMYFQPAPEGGADDRPAFNAGLVVFASAAFTLALGILPSKYYSLAWSSVNALLR